MTSPTSRSMPVSRAALASALAAIAFPALLATSAAAQDFECSAAARASEKAVCGNTRLSGLDERMSGLYARLMDAVDRDDQREGLRATQRRFLAARDRCGRHVGCIRGAYLDQIDVLSLRLRYAESKLDR